MTLYNARHVLHKIFPPYDTYSSFLSSIGRAGTHRDLPEDVFKHIKNLPKESLKDKRVTIDIQILSPTLFITVSELLDLVLDKDPGINNLH